MREITDALLHFSRGTRLMALCEATDLTTETETLRRQNTLLTGALWEFYESMICLFAVAFECLPGGVQQRLAEAQELLQDRLGRDGAAPPRPDRLTVRWAMFRKQVEQARRMLAEARKEER